MIKNMRAIRSNSRQTSRLISWGSFNTKLVIERTTQSRQIMDLASASEPIKVCIESLTTHSYGYGSQLFGAINLCLSYVVKQTYEEKPPALDHISSESRIRTLFFAKAANMTYIVCSAVCLITGDVGILMPGLLLSNFTSAICAPPGSAGRKMSTFATCIVLTGILVGFFVGYR